MQINTHTPEEGHTFFWHQQASTRPKPQEDRKHHQQNVSQKHPKYTGTRNTHNHADGTLLLSSLICLSKLQTNSIISKYQEDKDYTIMIRVAYAAVKKRRRPCACEWVESEGVGAQCEGVLIPGPHKHWYPHKAHSLPPPSQGTQSPSTLTRHTVFLHPDVVEAHATTLN